MTDIRTFMTDDHRRCDDFFAEAEEAINRGNVDAARSAFKQFESAILAHFEGEEKGLFPAFESKTGITMGPTQVMRMEHAQMRQLLNEANQALAAGDVDDYLGQAETLLIMMQQHNMKEENVLYPMCDQHLAAETSALVAWLQKELAAQ